MKKTVIKGSVFALIFLISLFTISKIVNKGNTDMTAEMKPATFPLVSMRVAGEKVNYLHGYEKEMDTAFQRDTITPIGTDRKINVEIEKYGNEIEEISFQVRSVNGNRLIEDNKVYNYLEQEDSITAEITIKDLIEENTEYAFILLLKTTNGNTIRFYTRIIQGDEYYLAEKINFVKDFHEKTFDKEAAKELTRYLESNTQGDNSGFHYVDIHSSFSQITWGDFLVQKASDVQISIKELGTQTASIQLEYFISLPKEKEGRIYRVNEFYRVRYGSDRMFLLDYERNMSQMFDLKTNPFVNNKIEIGITNPSIEMMESDGGTVVSYVYENCLYSYNAGEYKFTDIFSFYHIEDADKRDIYNANDIKILSVDETGNIRFMVYGYMNRGRHEGNVGIQIYYYNGALNTLEEELFIPYDKTYTALAADVEKLSYVSNTNIFYIMLDGTIYSIDLISQVYERIVTNLTEGSFEVSESGTMLAWQEDGVLEKNRKLFWMNLNTKKKTVIEVAAHERIKPLGFMGEDLIYGIAYESDISKDRLGKTVFPMYEMKIENDKRELLKNYKQDSIYVEGCVIDNNQITLKRLKKIEGTNAYDVIEDAQIMNNEAKEDGVNKVESVAVERFGKMVQIATKSTIPVKNLKFLTPKEVLYEGERSITLSNKEEKNSRYYVYGKKGVEESFAEPKNAIELADEIAGTVINEDGANVWMKGNRVVRNQIMAIKADGISEEKSSIAVCLDAMLKYEGILRNTEYMLKQGESVLSILEKNMEDASILDLSGCSLDAVLYYVNQDIPVIALLEDGSAVLIIGFNELNIVLMDPSSAIIYKKGMNDSATWFEENGNTFITYIPMED